MIRRKRLNFTDDVLKRADELVRGDRFIAQAAEWEGAPNLRIRTVVEVGQDGEDIFIRTTDRHNMWTSPGNTFLMVGPDQMDVREG